MQTMEKQEFDACLADVLEGDWSAMVKLSNYFKAMNSTSVSDQQKAQKEEAFRTLKNSQTEKVNASAFLGTLYLEGWGTKKNIVQALTLFRISARQNNIWGQI